MVDRRRLLAGLIITAVLTVVLWTSSALALPAPGSAIIKTKYYSSAAKTVIVGQRYRDCQGEDILTGTITSYYTNTYSPCSGY